MSLSWLSTQIIGQPYQLGEMDCLGVVLRWLDMRGVELPQEWEGFTANDYAQVYKTDAETAKCLSVALMDCLLPPIDPRRALPGDVLALTVDGSHVPFLAVHGGNVRVLTCTPEHGVTLLPLAGYRMRRAWSCHRQ